MSPDDDPSVSLPPVELLSPPVLVPEKSVDAPTP